MDTIDDIARRAAARVHAEADAVADVDAMWEELNATAAGSSNRGRWASRSMVPLGPRRWARMGATAVLAAAVVGGIVVVASRDTRREVVPAPSVTPTPEPTSVPNTMPPASTPLPTTSATATPTPASTVAPSTGDGLAVSYKNPPPVLEPQRLGSVELTDADVGNGMTVMETGVVVLDGTTATIVGWDGSTRSVQISIDFGFTGLMPLGAGPGEMLYAAATGVDQTNMTAATIVAVPLAGDRAGEVVATTPADVNVMIERPAAWVGHGSTGLVDREGLSGELVSYVDDTGSPWPQQLTIPEFRKDGDVITNVDGSQRWPLQIERSARHGDEYLGDSPPSPAPNGGATWWDTIGPPASGGDYPSGTIPVIAFLAPDGTATWRQIPAGWAVGASDVWGTILARVNGTTLDVALATPTIGAVQAVSPASATVQTYLTALAAADYATAAELLGNDGQSLESRPDLHPLRDRLLAGATLQEALRDWCQGTAGSAACWMPARVSESGPTDPQTVGPDGTVVIASYDLLDAGPQARYVTGSWEGSPSVYGLPPLVEHASLRRLRELLDIEALWTLHPDDPSTLVLSTATGSLNVDPPEPEASATVAPDGQTVWWYQSDGEALATGLDGTVICGPVSGQIVDLIGQPTAYRAIVERQGDAGPAADPLPTPTFEIDCTTGTEVPAEPRSWNGGPVARRLVTVGERSYTLTSTDHHVEVVNQAGLALGSDDSIITRPDFNVDGSIIVYGVNAGSANPNEVTRYVARNTTTDGVLWTFDPPTTATGLQVSADRVIVTVSSDDAQPALGTTSVIALDLVTGEVVMEVPATFTVVDVG